MAYRQRRGRNSFLKPRSSPKWIEVQGPKGVFKITPQEYKDFQYYENLIERKYNRITESVNPTVGTAFGNLANPKTPIFRMGKKRSIENFTSRDAVVKQMAMRKKQLKPSFFTDRSNIYRQNLITAITKVFGSAGAELVAEIGKLTSDQLQFLLIQNPYDFGIDYVYNDPGEMNERLEWMLDLVKQAQGIDIDYNI